MEKEMKNDLVATWNEVNEVLADFDLSEQEIIEVLPTMQIRLENALHWLGKYVNEEDVLQELKN